jgi:hypothetical protein
MLLLISEAISLDVSPFSNGIVVSNFQLSKNTFVLMYKVRWFHFFLLCNVLIAFLEQLQGKIKLLISLLNKGEGLPCDFINVFITAKIS